MTSRRQATTLRCERESPSLRVGATVDGTTSVFTDMGIGREAATVSSDQGNTARTGGRNIIRIPDLPSRVRLAYSRELGPRDDGARTDSYTTLPLCNLAI